MDSLAKAPMQTKIAATWMWKHYLWNGRTHVPKYGVPLREVNFHHLPHATIVVCEFDFFPCLLSENFYAQQIELFKKIINQKK
ncbi:hypothetical protein D3C86_1769780 [compost metagenome]